MSTANETTVTVTFDPNSVSKQADVIGPATPQRAGAMTAAQAEKLANGASIWDRLVPPGDPVTTDATPVVASQTDLLHDGIISFIANVVATNPDATDWAVWLLAPITAVRSNGVLSVVFPVGPVNPTGMNGGPTSGTWTLEIVAVGNTIQFKVKGAAGVTVQWGFQAGGNVAPNP